MVLSAAYLVFWRVRYYPPGPVPWMGVRQGSEPCPAVYCIFLFYPPPPFDCPLCARRERGGAGEGSYSPSRSLFCPFRPPNSCSGRRITTKILRASAVDFVFHATLRTRLSESFFFPLLQEGFPREHEKRHRREPIVLSHNLSSGKSPTQPGFSIYPKSYRGSGVHTSSHSKGGA